MRRGEGCIDWIVHSTIHEVNKLYLLTSACPASFSLSTHLVPSVFLCLLLSLLVSLFWFLSFHSCISFFDFFLSFLGSCSYLWIMNCPKSHSQFVYCLLEAGNVRPSLSVTLSLPRISIYISCIAHTPFITVFYSWLSLLQHWTPLAITFQLSLWPPIHDTEGEVQCHKSATHRKTIYET